MIPDAKPPHTNFRRQKGPKLKSHPPLLGGLLAPKTARPCITATLPSLLLSIHSRYVPLLHVKELFYRTTVANPLSLRYRTNIKHVWLKTLTRCGVVINNKALLPLSALHAPLGSTTAKTLLTPPLRWRGSNHITGSRFIFQECLTCLLQAYRRRS